VDDNRRTTDDDEPTWASMTARERVLAAFGMTGLGLGVAAVVVLFLLLGVLVIAVVCDGLIEADGVTPFVWAALLCVPCGLLASLFVYPLRLLTRMSGVGGGRKRAAEAGISGAGTFLAALFVESFTPGLSVARPWIPALLAMMLVAGANVGIARAEERKARRSGG